MATAVGAGFDISKLLDSITKADKALTNLMDKSNQASRSIITAFQQINSQGVVPYVQSLEEQKKTLEQVKASITDVSGRAKKGFGDMKASIIDATNSLTTMINSLKNTSQYKTQTKLIDLSQQIDELQKYQQRQDEVRESSNRAAQQEINNYRQILSEIQRLNEVKKQAKEAKSSTTDGSLKSDAAKTLTEANKQLKIYKQQAKEIEQKYAVETELVKKDIALRGFQDRLRAEQDYQNKVLKIQEESNRRARALQDAKADSSKGALNYYNRLYSDKGVMSINNMNTALQKLRDAQNRLNLSTDEGKRRHKELGEAIHRVEGDMKKYSSLANEVSNKHKTLMNTGEQLKRALLGIFSVSAIKGYVSKLVEVRGEFELQHRALQVLVGDVSEANRLWDKTVQLAVKSPFAVKELVTYTKQLSAYRVESDKLYDTTKMLADISAGLGVDMNRLILAYGQVKAANYLRGTELRQFSEAGINVLKELSDYYTEIENKTVSVGEVFDRVSKRMVSFQDVNAVLEKVTGAGGQFYKMQEQQAETLKGVWMNMRDSVDLMLNDIGSKNSSILKGTLSIAKSVVDNWEKVGNIIVPLFSMIVAKMAVMRTMSFFNEGSFKVGINKMSYLLRLLTKGRVAADRFALSLDDVNAKSLKMSAIGTGISAVILLIAKLTMEFVKHRAELKAIDKEYENIRESLSDITFNFNVAKNEGDLKKQKDSLNELVSIANKEYSLGVKIDIKSMTQEEVDQKVQEVTGQILRITSLAQEAAKAGKGNWFDNIFSDDANEDAEDYGDAFSNVSSKIILHAKNAANALIEYKNAGNDLTEVQKEALKEFTTPFDTKKETEVQYVIRLTEAYKKLNEEADKHATQAYWEESGDQSRIDIYKNYGISEEVDNAIKLLEVDEKRFKDELNRFFDEIDKNLDRSATDEQKRIDIKAVIDKQAWSDSAKEFAYKLANERFSVNITPTIKQPETKTLANWAQRFNETFKEQIKLYGWLDEIKWDTDENTFLSQMENKAKEAKALYESFDNGAKRYTQIEADAARAEEQVAKMIIEWFKGVQKEDGDGETEKKLNKRISLIKGLREEYIKLNKTFDESESKERVSDSFRSALKQAGMDIEKIDFTSEIGIIEALKKLKPIAEKEGLEAKIALEKAIGEVQVEIDVKDTKDEQDKLLEQIEDMFGNYEISLELDKLNIPPDLAKQLFGVDAISLDDIRSEIETKLTDARTVGGQEDYVKDLEKQLEKVKELEDKQLKERLKTYTEYLTKEQNTRVRMKLEELRKLEEVEELYNQGKYTQEQYDTITGNIRREAAAEQAKQTWEDFAKTPYIVQMFDDLDKTSNKSLELLNDQLQTLKTSLYNAGLPASELKEILDKINQVEKELEARNPFAQIGRGIKDLFTGNIDLTRFRKEYDDQIAKQAEADKAHENAVKDLNEYNEKHGEFGGNQAERRKLLDTVERTKQEAEKLRDETQQATENFENARRKVLGMAEGLSAVLGYAQQLGSAFGDMADKLGIMSEEEQAILNNAMNVVGDVANIGMAAAQIAANPANPAAWVQGISSVMSLIGNIAATGDAVREKEIQSEMKKIDRLEKAYEKLEKAMDDAYTFDQMRSNRMSMEQNIDAQIKALESANAKEEAMKKKDQDQIDANYEKIAELEEKKAELQRETVERLGGTYDYASVAEQFLDAWLEAFKETGDGLSGLEDNFDEFFSELAKKQLIYGGITELLKPLQTAINEDLGDNQQIDDWGALIKGYGNVITNIHEFLTGAVSNLKSAGLDIFSGEGGELSGLSKGVQGITETQADILAAYWNAVRFDVSAIRQRFDEYLATQGISEDANPMMTVLNSQLEQLKAIRGVLDDAIASGDSTAGAFRVRVVEMN